jgi:excisionase family DNA binding protein
MAKSPETDTSRAFAVFANPQEKMNDLLTRKEAATLARVCPLTLDRLIKAQDGPAIIRVGRRILIRRTEFERWLDSKTERQGTATL